MTAAGRPASELPLPRHVPAASGGLAMLSPSTNRTINSMFAEFDPPDIAISISIPDAAERGIADGDNLQVFEIDIFLCHALNVIGCNGRHPLRVSIPVISGQVVKLLRDDVLEKCVWLLKRESEAADNSALGVL